MQKILIASTFAATLVISACSDTTLAPEPIAPPSAKVDMATFVSIGTSISMGWYNDGVLFSSQEQAWTRKVANAAGVNFTMPMIAAPGCQPPLAAPLGSFARVDGTSIASDSNVCGDLMTGSTPGSSSLAVENATALEALTATPATASSGRGPVTSRVLPSGLTQITAMRAKKPTFVSVEFGGNEILPAQVGVLAPGVTFVPYATFADAYSKIIDSVKATGAKAVLVTLPTDLRKFPTIRTGAELASQRAVFAAMNVSVNANCDASPNFFFVRGLVPTAVATGAGLAAAGAGPYDLNCDDAPGKPDFILTPADVNFLNDLASQMNALITSKASANGYAVFSLGALYDTAKDGVAFNVQSYMTSAAPYGPVISLDGVHPNAAGHAVLAAAAIKAINARYGYTIAIPQ